MEVEGEGGREDTYRQPLRFSRECLASSLWDRMVQLTNDGDDDNDELMLNVFRCQLTY